MKRAQISREPMPYGNVLIVDDVETNIYVAGGLMSPYKLKIDSADSGFAAIEKIKNGKVYDVVFMDHMMPRMDGIEATKIIRDMGYDRPIVALTANAVAGQAEIFLGNGFDDFISKPIDIRQLNAVLNKLVRDRQPPEVVEAARNMDKSEKDQPPGNVRQPVGDPRFAEIFLRDAQRTLETLEEISCRDNYGNENDLRAYIINIHGIKSALANIGEIEMSATALKLELAGREGKLEILRAETSAFLSLLKAFVEKLKPRDETAGGGDCADEDKPYLIEKLVLIKKACAVYDKKAANEALAELRKMEWSRRTQNLLGKIAEQLLHSDFDEIKAAINDFI